MSVCLLNWFPFSLKKEYHFTQEKQQSIADQQPKNRYTFNKNISFTNLSISYTLDVLWKQRPVTSLVHVCHSPDRVTFYPVNNTRQHVFASVITLCSRVFLLEEQICFTKHAPSIFCYRSFLCPTICPLGPLLLTWFSFNPSMDK